MTDKTLIANREAWLIAATDKLQATFKRAGKDIPPVTVACGWPSARGLSKKKRTIGQCWDGECSADGKPQIFISPAMDHELHCEKPIGEAVGDCQGVLPTLAHELVHGVLGTKEGHNKVFGKLARAIGLEGKMTSTHAGEKLLQECKDIVAIIGPYPHAAINPLLKGGPKKQGTRMLKCTCEAEGCGFQVRTTKKWLDKVGAPHCPKHGAMTPELPEEDGDGESGEE